jgi:Fur family ferric uptake transcriptional regulator
MVEKTTWLDAILDQLHARGERLTFQRRIVIEALANHVDHVTIQDIQRYVEDKYTLQVLHEVTIYRILQWLKDLQLVSQTDMGAAGIVYQRLNQRHHHLICLKCGAVEDIDDDFLSDLRHKLADDYHFSARIDHMAIYGHCEKCLHSSPSL